MIDNIFVFAGEGASWGSVPTSERGMVLDNNIVIGLDDPEYIKLSDDPVFASPGDGGSEIDMHDPDRLKGFRLCKGSPAIDAGSSKATTRPRPISGAKEITKRQHRGRWWPLGLSAATNHLKVIRKCSRTIETY